MEYEKTSEQPKPYPQAFSLKLIRERSPLVMPEGGRTVIQNPQEVAMMFTQLYGLEPFEVFVGFFLDTQHRLLGHALISRGTLDASLISPREVFAHAILANAAAIILVHNHPSGNHRPSTDDVTVTKQLTIAAAVMGIPIIDHIVVGEAGTFTSLATEGMMV